MSIAKPLLQWYKKNGRQDLPWRLNLSPYRVWLSEIMLQQTQVTTVIPYFKKFLQDFPNVTALANASIDDVLRHWAGLGYYSRARNLHKSAKIIVEQFNGVFPKDAQTLAELPGIGLSTAHAICSIVYNQVTPILDGNVKRVLARLYAVHGFPGSTKTNQQLWQLAKQTMRTKNASDYTQAIMDLGATICKRQKPACIICPLQKQCLAYQKDLTEVLPERKPKRSLPEKEIALLVIKFSNSEILLEKRPPTGIWGGLWSLPECPVDSCPEDWVAKHYGFTTKMVAELPRFKHTFTHYHLFIQPIILNINKSNKLAIKQTPHLLKYDLQSATAIGTPTPIRKIFACIK